MSDDFSCICCDSLRTRIAAVLDGQINGYWNVETLRLADAVIELLIDMAGHGELLRAIDALSRNPRSAEKLGLVGDGE